MSETRFTPGPWNWTFDKEGGFPYIYASSESMPVLMNLCAPNEKKQKEMIANAVLTASAPEMYAMLRTILDNSVVNGVYRVQAEKILKKAIGQ